MVARGCSREARHTRVRAARRRPPMWPSARRIVASSNRAIRATCCGRRYGTASTRRGSAGREAGGRRTFAKRRSWRPGVGGSGGRCGDVPCRSRVPSIEGVAQTVPRGSVGVSPPPPERRMTGVTWDDEDARLTPLQSAHGYLGPPRRSCLERIHGLPRDTRTKAIHLAPARAVEAVAVAPCPAWGRV